MTSVNSKYVSLAANRTFFSTLDTRVNHVLRVDSFNRVKQFFFVFFFFICARIYHAWTAFEIF